MARIVQDVLDHFAQPEYWRDLESKDFMRDMELNVQSFADVLLDSRYSAGKLSRFVSIFSNDDVLGQMFFEQLLELRAIISIIACSARRRWHVRRHRLNALRDTVDSVILSRLHSSIRREVRLEAEREHWIKIAGVCARRPARFGSCGAAIVRIVTEALSAEQLLPQAVMQLGSQNIYRVLDTLRWLNGCWPVLRADSDAAEAMLHFLYDGQAEYKEVEHTVAKVRFIRKLFPLFAAEKYAEWRTFLVHDVGKHWESNDSPRVCRECRRTLELMAEV